MRTAVGIVIIACSIGLLLAVRAGFSDGAPPRIVPAMARSAEAERIRPVMPHARIRPAAARPNAAPRVSEPPARVDPPSARDFNDELSEASWFNLEAYDPDRTFFGRVVSATDGRPIAGASISYDGAPGRTEWSSLDVLDWRFVRFGTVIDGASVAVTDTAGRFRLNRSSRQLDWFKVTATGYTPTAVPFSPNHHTTATVMTVRMIEAAQLDVRSAHRDVSVRVRVDDEHLLESGVFPDNRWQGAAGPHASLRLHGLPAAVPLRVECTASIGASVVTVHRASVVLRPGRPETLRVPGLGSCTIHGTIVDEEGRPASGVYVRLAAPEDRPSSFSVMACVDIDISEMKWGDDEEHGELRWEGDDEVRTDAAGRFRLEDVPAGDWRVRYNLQSTGVGHAFQVATVRVPQGCSDRQVALRLRPMGEIAGRIVDPAGGPVFGADVTVGGADGPVYLRTSTDENGAFSLRTIPVERCSLRVDPGWYPAHAHGLVATELHGISATRDLLIHLPFGGALKGEMRDAVTGRPRPGVVTVHHRESGDTLSRNVGPDGAFHFSGVRGGIVDAVARSPGGWIGTRRERVSVHSNAKPTVSTVDVSRGGYLVLRRRGTEPIDVRVECGDTLIRACSLDGNSMAELLVPAGRVRVVLTACGVRRSHTVVITAGLRTELAPADQ